MKPSKLSRLKSDIESPLQTRLVDSFSDDIAPQPTQPTSPYSSPIQTRLHSIQNDDKVPLPTHRSSQGNVNLATPLVVVTAASVVEKPSKVESKQLFASLTDKLAIYSDRFLSSRWAKISVFASFSLLFCFSVVSYLARVQSSLVQIALFGDSLIAMSDQQYRLSVGVEQLLSTIRPDNFVSVYAWGHGGYRVNRLRANLFRILQHQSIKNTFTGNPAPHAVVVYWDSDCSDVIETPSSVAQIRANYIENLQYILTELTANIPCVIVAGPSLYGELPRGQNWKDTMFDEYVDLNRNITAQFNIPYIDTRSAFFASLPSYWRKSTGYLTIDGEHHNSHGVLLVQGLFAKALDECPGLQPFWKPKLAP